MLCVKSPTLQIVQALPFGQLETQLAHISVDKTQLRKEGSQRLASLQLSTSKRSFDLKALCSNLTLSDWTGLFAAMCMGGEAQLPRSDSYPLAILSSASVGDDREIQACRGLFFRREKIEPANVSEG